MKEQLTDEQLWLMCEAEERRIKEQIINSVDKDDEPSFMDWWNEAIKN